MNGKKIASLALMSIILTPIILGLLFFICGVITVIWAISAPLLEDALDIEVISYVVLWNVLFDYFWAIITLSFATALLTNLRLTRPLS